MSNRNCSKCEHLRTHNSMLCPWYKCGKLRKSVVSKMVIEIKKNKLKSFYCKYFIEKEVLTT